MLVEIGSVAKGTVAKVVPYGAIVRIEGGKTGLVHISEIADTFVNQVSDYLNEGDPVLVKVVGISDRGRYELSVKRVSAQDYATHGLAAPTPPVPATPSPKDAPRPPSRRDGRQDFERKLSEFLKDSEERLAPLRAAATAKRGRRKSKKSASSSGSS
jgi:S1 RNA binding domain protein